MSTTDLTRTPSSGGNRKIWTFSAWLKRAVKSDTNNSRIFSAGAAQTDYTAWFMGAVDGTDGRLFFQNRVSNSTTELASSRQFRDVNGWYHLVIACDTTQATDSNRVKIYVNGVQETLTGAYPAQNVDTFVNHTTEHNIGSADGAGYTPRYWAGSMSHVHLVDGSALAPTVFGFTDSTTGEWKIKASPSYTVGTNGFFILKDGNSVTDQSTNTNNFTVSGGTLTKTEDNPSNVFCTINPLLLSISNMTIQSGNTAKRTQSGSNAWRSEYGTLGASSGKFYYEFKIEQINNSDPNNFWIGIVDADQMVNTSNNERFYQQSRGYGYHAQSGSQGNNNSTSSYGATYTAGDIIGVALDLDNSKLYFHKNGTYQNSGVPTSGSTGTGAINISSGYTYLPAIAQYYSDEKWSANFGNGDFNAAGISSAGTNASGHGIFEYDVPTGYTALCTKGLNL